MTTDIDAAAASTAAAASSRPDGATDDIPAQAPQSVPAGVPEDLVVDAVLVAREATRWLPQTLEALAASTRRPRRLVVVDTDGTAHAVVESADERALADDVRVTDARGCTGPADATARGLEALDAAGDRAPLVWVLHDDVSPEPDALQHLLAAAAAEPTAGILGPKHVVASDPERLVEVGITLTRAGRPLAEPRHGELDQGQHDDRHDVLAVSLAGALVRREVIDRLGGLDGTLAGRSADVDLCWRAHQAGHRVVVVPEARVGDVRAGARGLRDFEQMPFAGHTLAELHEHGYGSSEVARERKGWDRERRARARAAERRYRRGLRRTAIDRAPWWVAPFRAVGLVLGALVTALVLLLLKRPRAARAELADAGAVLHPVSSLRSRQRARSTTTVPARELRGLFAGRGPALRSVLDEMYLALPHLPDSAAHADPDAVVEPGPVDDEALDLPSAAIGVNPGLVAVALASVVAALAWRPLLGTDPLDALRHGLAGGELTGADGSARDLVRAYLTGTTPGSTGSDTPWSLVLGALAWVLGLVPGLRHLPTVGAATSLVMLAAVPLSALTAYLAARVVTRRGWPRAAVALLWALLPTLVLGLRSGRLGIAVVHVLLPLVLAGIALTARRRPTVWVVAVTVLTAAVATAFAPLVGILTLVAGLAVAVRGRRRPASGRLAGIALAVLPLVLQGPVVLTWLVEPWRLLLGPGLVDRDAAPPAPWALALGWPNDPVVGGPVPQGWAPWAPLLTLGVVVVGVVGLARRGRHDRAQSRLAVLALVGLGLALWAARTTVARDYPAGSTSLANLSPWPGVALDLLLGSLLAAALVATERRTTLDLPGRARVASQVAHGVLGLTAVLLAAWVATTTIGSPLTAAADPLPEAARAQAASELATRSVVLHAGGTAAAPTVSWSLVGTEPGPVVRGLPGEDVPAVPQHALTAAISAAVDGTGAAPGRDLHDLGIGFVTLADDLASSTAVTGHLDTAEGLARITGAADPTWRVQPVSSPSGDAVLPSRARVTGTGEKGAPTVLAALPMTDGRVEAALPQGATGLVLADDVDSATSLEVRADGALLRAVPDARGLASYALPDGAEEITVTPVLAHPVWSWVQLALLVLVALMALPFGAHRPTGGASR